jgi:hypothetical protein
MSNNQFNYQTIKLSNKYMKCLVIVSHTAKHKQWVISIF